MILILDFDGVLVDLNIDWAQVRRDVSKAVPQLSSLNAFWEEHYSTEIFEKASRIAERYEQEALRRARPREDIGAALAGWKGRCYIASMQPESVLEIFVKANNIGSHISEILGRGRFGSKKKQLAYIVQKEGGPLQNFVVIDDSKLNQRACGELGLRCILFGKGDRLSDVISRLNRGL